MKTEFWNGSKLRFVENGGDWWVVAADVCAALGLKNVTMALEVVDSENRKKCALNSIEGAENADFNPSDANLINELGIYQLIFKSRKKEAVELQKWIFGILKELRRAAGLEGFEVFRGVSYARQRKAERDHGETSQRIKRDN